MSPILKSVEAAGIHGLARKRNPFEIKTQDFFYLPDELRQAFAELINAQNPQRIVLIPSVSYGMAIVAKNLNLEAGQNIIVAGEQFPSNVYPWQRMAQECKAAIQIIPAPENFENRGKTWNQRILEAINPKTRLVSLAHVHWADGTKYDLAAIRKRTREVGALLVIDGTQSVGALPFDVQQLEPDALICAGYKWLLGSYGLGLAYFGEYFDNGKPLEENWINRFGSEDFSNLVNYQEKYQGGAMRYEMGERSNFVTVPMLLTAIQQIQAWGVNNIQMYCQSISNQAITNLQRNGFFVENADYRGWHLFGVRLPAHLALDKVKAALDQAHIYVSMRGSAIRVAPHIYNTEADLKKLVDCLLSFV
jgi:selenocysteine lyase/cysteine desulfurase